MSNNKGHPQCGAMLTTQKKDQTMTAGHAGAGDEPGAKYTPHARDRPIF
jgi:hypothetical protein